MKSSRIRHQFTREKAPRANLRNDDQSKQPDLATVELAIDLKRALLQKQYEKAISITLRKGSGEREVLNVRGVCYLRTGNIAEAVKLYRSLALEPGCTWLRKNCPPHFVINFAAALLLSGHPHGCLGVLRELGKDISPQAVQLRRAVADWEATLSWWDWLNWKLLRVEPAMEVLPLTFEPGVIPASLQME